MQEDVFSKRNASHCDTHIVILAQAYFSYICIKQTHRNAYFHIYKNNNLMYDIMCPDLTWT